MAHTQPLSLLVLALALSACGGLSDDPDSRAATSPSSLPSESTALEVVIHGEDLAMDVDAEGRALVVAGGIRGLTTVSWAPERGWSAPVEIMPAVVKEDPSHGSYREVITQLHAVALGANGEAWVLYSALAGALFTEEARIDLYARHRPAPGVASGGADADWEPAELVARVGMGRTNDPYPVDAALALGASGHVGVVWAQRSEPMRVRTRDPIAGWSEATALDRSGSGGFGPLQISADAAGNMAIVWQNETDTRAWQGASQTWSPASTVAPRVPALSTSSKDGDLWLVSDSEQGLVAWQQAPTGNAARENLGFGANHYLYKLDVAAADRALLAYAVDEWGEFTLEGPPDGLIVAQRAAGTSWGTPELYDTTPMGGVAVALNSRGDGIVFWRGTSFGYRRLGSNETVILGTGSQTPRAAALAEDGRALLAWSANSNTDEQHVRWVE